MTYDIALIERHVDNAPNRREWERLLNAMADSPAAPDILPLDIPNPNGDDSYAYGFITYKAAESLNFNYGPDTDIGKFIKEYLFDTDDSTHVLADQFTYNGLEIYLGRTAPK